MINTSEMYKNSGLNLPDSMIKAQESINLPEVQEIIKKLSEFNLGVCMPHFHEEVSGNFQELPKDVVQIEADMQVSFANQSTLNEIKGIPVAWRWINDGVKVGAACLRICTPIEHGGLSGHNKQHGKY